MPDVPDQLVLKRHRDLEGLRYLIWVRRALLAVVVAFLALGLTSAFGQSPATTSVAGVTARLSLTAPGRLRGGLIFEARFRVHAIGELRNAFVVLDPGWIEGITINTIEPSPVGEASRNGRLAFQLGHVPKGGTYVLYLQLQVNPTTVGDRTQNVALYDGDTRLLTVEHSATIFP